MPPKEKDNEEKACSSRRQNRLPIRIKKTGKPGVKLTVRSPKCREAKACRLVAKENDKCRML